jgi:hypothetical protein
MFDIINGFFDGIFKISRSLRGCCLRFFIYLRNRLCAYRQIVLLLGNRLNAYRQIVLLFFFFFELCLYRFLC